MSRRLLVGSLIALFVNCALRKLSSAYIGIPLLIPQPLLFLADALLADLQNSVPGQPAKDPPRHNFSPVNGQSGASPGYGSVRPKQQAASPTSVSCLIEGCTISQGCSSVSSQWKHWALRSSD